MRKYLILMVLFVLSLAAVYPPEVGGANDAEPGSVSEIESLIDNGGYAVLKNGKYITSHNLHLSYIPASIIKIATALAAIDSLGPSFRFPTSFYRDEQANLYVKGFGDPFLISEEVVAIVKKLKKLGCTRINNIFLDNSAFHLVGATDGSGLSDNPYDAQNSALAVNFNTVNITKDAAGRVISAEEQTPTLQLMAKLAENLEPGTHRINITLGKNAGDSIINRYAGELFRAVQRQENISGEGIIAVRKIPDKLKPFYIHRSSKTLADIIEPLMLYSNNFIANQLFLSVGAGKFGYPATWEKGRKAMAGYLHNKINLPKNEIVIIEGSGLSRNNRVSPHAMIQLLASFKPYYNLLPQEDGKFLKSGTLARVYSYAGYFMENERLDSFVLLLNQRKNNRERVMDMLEGIHRLN